MAGEIVNFDSSEVIFGRYTSETKFIESKTNEIEHYFIGQHVTLLVKLKLSNETVNRLKSVHPPGRSPLLENINTSIKRQLNHGVDVRYKVVPLKKLPSIALHSSTDCLTCHVTASHHEESEQQNEQSLEPTFSCDKKFYHKPVRVTIPELPFETSLASLVILIQPACKHTPRWLSSPAKLDTFDNLQEVTNDKAEGGKLVSRKFKVIHPPFMMFQQISVGSQKTVFLEVSNLSQKPAVIKECFFKPAICPKSGTSLPCKKETTNERLCLLHSDNIATLMNDQGTILPERLLPGEKVSLAANINVNALHNSCLKDELSWEAQLTWAIDKDSMKQFTIATTYRLPNLKLKKGLFIMSACCNKSSFKKGERVCITYTIQNNLHEFLSIRLSWQPPSAVHVR
ncbi:trafficking protein particle complex subunit 14-like [Dreissena polymorpha]|uniref:trafficking protein particle complex subunit 14-like n=1 Tax=Dreissena polymorpha TaxID=45954 RepID=UPI002263BCF5|nr:trafficking protein particle complex subunit 14-like [Dreissena polymorpha]